MRYIKEGLYHDIYDLRMEDSSINWDYLECEDYLEPGEIDFLRFLGIEIEDFNIDMFLHGYCYAFANCLNLKYGYEMQCIYDKKTDKLVHAYCVAEYNDNPIFIDARGILSDWEDFIEEFREYLPYDGKIPYPLPDIHYGTFEEFKDEAKEPFLVAKTLIDSNDEFYNVWKTIYG